MQIALVAHLLAVLNCSKNTVNKTAVCSNCIEFMMRALKCHIHSYLHGNLQKKAVCVFSPAVDEDDDEIPYDPFGDDDDSKEDDGRSTPAVDLSIPSIISTVASVVKPAASISSVCVCNTDACSDF